jgi:predicted naringenin-chalcone synthase
MYLASLASALPEKSWSQEECWAALRDSPVAASLRRRSLDLVERVLLGDSGIERRHFCTEHLGSLLGRSAQQLNQSFEREAPLLATCALRTAMERADVATVDALFICTCTGYLCPGLTSHVAEAAGLAPGTYLLDVTGAGCGAAIPTLRAACNYLAAHPGHRVGVVAVEVCSAAFYVSDDPGVLISLCLSGDGAAAAILDARSTRAPRFSDFASLHYPAEREKIRFVNRDGKLCNQLHRAVPEVAAGAVEQLFPRQNGTSPRLISHTGGRDVLAAIRARLPDQPLVESAAVLRDCGNLSSPSVLLAAEKALASPSLHGDSLISFGAGFACHSCRLG